jgi:hypothetical protein
MKNDAGQKDLSDCAGHDGGIQALRELWRVQGDDTATGEPTTAFVDPAKHTGEDENDHEADGVHGGTPASAPTSKPAEDRGSASEPSPTETGSTTLWSPASTSTPSFTETGDTIFSVAWSSSRGRVRRHHHRGEETTSNTFVEAAHSIGDIVFWFRHHGNQRHRHDQPSATVEGVIFAFRKGLKAQGNNASQPNSSNGWLASLGWTSIGARNRH